VGDGTTAQVFEAALWDAQGVHRLHDYLQTLGIGSALDGWTLQTAYGISRDGLTIVGVGINPNGRTEAWLATIPEPACSTLALVLPLVWRRQRWV
jgi:hypothetical protein